MTSDAVRAYYASLGEREWERLENPADGALEFAITCHTLAAHLAPRQLPEEPGPDRDQPRQNRDQPRQNRDQPRQNRDKPGARVLDIGGGPGRYTIWLAQRGHRVVLADPSRELLAVAKAKIEQAGVGAMVEDIVEANACDLSLWADDSFDAVLSLGPFYHLPDATERHRAAAEMGRVLRPAGIAFVALMPRYAFLRRTLAIPDERHHLKQPEFVARLLEDGVFINDIPGRFTHGYGVRPEDVGPFFEQYGFTTLVLLAAESIVVDLQSKLYEMAAGDPDGYEAAFEVIVRTASDPSILGMARHLLYVGRNC